MLIRSVKAVTISLLVFLSSQAFAINVLGFSIDEKFVAESCVGDVARTKKTCWVGPPFIHKGSKSGLVRIPEDSNIPKWAVFGVYEIYVDASQVLRSIKVRLSSLVHAGEIVDSISRRFGRASILTLPSSSWVVYTWDTKDLYIKMYCGTECVVDFLSSTLKKEQDAKSLAVKRRDDMRPVAP